MTRLTFSLTLLNYFSKLLVLDENLFQEKYKNVNIVNPDSPFIVTTLIVLGSNNNSSKPVACEENFLQGVGMQELDSNFLKEEK